MSKRSASLWDAVCMRFENYQSAKLTSEQVADDIATSLATSIQLSAKLMEGMGFGDYAANLALLKSQIAKNSEIELIEEIQTTVF